MLQHFPSLISGWIFSSLCDIYMYQDESNMHKLSLSLHPGKNELLNQESWSTTCCSTKATLWDKRVGWVSRMKYEKNIAVAIHKLLADFEDRRMELGDKKGETLLA